VLQAVGGHFSGSVAVLFDCGHLLCDACGLLAVLTASRMAVRTPTPVMTFGFQRAGLLQVFSLNKNSFINFVEKLFYNFIV
jgi:cobalt-zinc-cadmium efflux system protein